VCHRDRSVGNTDRRDPAVERTGTDDTIAATPKWRRGPVATLARIGQLRRGIASRSSGGRVALAFRAVRRPASGAISLATRRSFSAVGVSGSLPKCRRARWDGSPHRRAGDGVRGVLVDDSSSPPVRACDDRIVRDNVPAGLAHIEDRIVLCRSMVPRIAPSGEANAFDVILADGRAGPEYLWPESAGSWAVRA
jgi:hypothetical protein